MFTSYSRFIAEQAVGTPLRFRQLALIIIDAFLLVLSVWLSFWLRLADPFHTSFQTVGIWLLPAALCIGLPLYATTGQYKGLTRYAGSRALYRLAGRNGLLVLLLSITGVMMRLPMPPRSSWILLWFLLTGFTGVVRFALRDLLLSLFSTTYNKMERVAIYGAGVAGAQLAASLRLAGKHHIVTFLDDSPVLWQRSINGIPIHPPQVLGQIKDQLDQVLLAIPSLTRSERRRIVSDLQPHFRPNTYR
jgi:FlaA1/EpsC-like NDP-sugar epimerase